MLHGYRSKCMNQLAPISAPASRRFLEFITANIRNPHTRRAYGQAISAFLTWCEDHGVLSITDVQPIHIATWIERWTRGDLRADRQAARGGVAAPIRLAGDRPGGAGQSGRFGARAEARHQERQDAGA